MLWHFYPTQTYICLHSHCAFSRCHRAHLPTYSLTLAHHRKSFRKLTGQEASPSYWTTSDWIEPEQIRKQTATVWIRTWRKTGLDDMWVVNTRTKVECWLWERQIRWKTLLVVQCYWRRESGCLLPFPRVYQQRHTPQIGTATHWVITWHIG
jgi:hypothetical protein